MAFPPLKVSNTQLTVISAGTKHAKIIGLAAIGTQTTDYKGTKTKNPKMIIIFEISEHMELLTKMYTLSMNPKATLRRELEIILGPFHSEAEASELDLTQLLGISCQIHVVQKNTSKGISVVVQTVLPAAENAPSFTSERDLICFDVNNPDMDMFAKLPESIRKKVEASPEWQERQLAA